MAVHSHEEECDEKWMKLQTQEADRFQEHLGFQNDGDDVESQATDVTAKGKDVEDVEVTAASQSLKRLKLQALPQAPRNPDLGRSIKSCKQKVGRNHCSRS